MKITLSSIYRQFPNSKSIKVSEISLNSNWNTVRFSNPIMNSYELIPYINRGVDKFRFTVVDKFGKSNIVEISTKRLTNAI